MAKLSNNKNSLIFTEQGTPYSQKFDDVYFDRESGFKQSQQVFIEGNQLKERLLNVKQTKGQTKLTIAETGFGTGLNFLLTLCTYHLLEQKRIQAAKADHIAPHSLANIEFISVEKYPLTKSQLQQSLTLFPELIPYITLLTEQYPQQPSGECQLSFFDGHVTLKLIIDDASQALAKLFPAPVPPMLGCPNYPLVDIWYLDGFSPEKNPAMWSNELFVQIARLSKPQATLATFTVAGFVRRGLSEVGFRLQKKLNHGKKREILVGTFQTAPFGKGYQQRPNRIKPQQVTIIGGGIAAACAAYALTKQGVKVVVYCKDSEIAQGASSNAIGALFPLIHQYPDDISHFYQQAFWRAKSFYQDINTQGFEFSHDWCGLLDLAFNDKLKTFQQKFEQLHLWPDELVHSVDKKGASERAKLALNDGGLFYPEAGWIAPQECVQQVFSAAQQTGKLRIRCNVKVESIRQSLSQKKETNQDNNKEKTWLLSTNKGEISAKVLLLCGGAEALTLNVLQQSSLVAIRGQVSSMKPNNHTEKLATVICHKGYLTPVHHNQQCIGASFERGTTDTSAKTEEDIYNLTMLEQCLPKVTQWQLSDVISAKARLRCASPDHFPMVGAMPDTEQHKTAYAHLAKDKNFTVHTPAPCLDNLYILSGLGARGLCSAPLLADIITADLCGLPYPVSYQMLYNLAPNRFVIKDIVQHKLPV